MPVGDKDVRFDSFDRSKMNCDRALSVYCRDEKEMDGIFSFYFLYVCLLILFIGTGTLLVDLS